MNTTEEKNPKPSAPNALVSLLMGFQRGYGPRRRRPKALASLVVMGLVACSSGNAPDQTGAEPAASSQDQAVQQNGPPSPEQKEPLSPAEQVYEDQVNKYAFLVNNGGRAVEGCVQAGIAKTAAENLNNRVLFQRWQFVEQAVCGRDRSNPTIQSIADNITADEGGLDPNQPYHGEKAYRSWVEGEWLDIGALKD